MQFALYKSWKVDMDTFQNLVTTTYERIYVQNRKRLKHQEQHGIKLLITFRIKCGYDLKLFGPDTKNHLKSSVKLTTKDRNSDNVISFVTNMTQESCLNLFQVGHSTSY